MKLIVELTNKDLLKKYLKIESVQYLIIGYKGLSFNIHSKFNMDDIIEINNTIKNTIKNTNIGLILNAERLFSDNDLSIVDKLIEQKFFTYFDYVTYSDFGFKTYLENKGVNIKYIYKAPTYLTNYYDVNLYNEINDYVCVSSEISSKELIDLTNKIDKSILIDLFGQSSCFYSRRKLISRYFEYRLIDKDANKDNYFIVEELRNDYLPIIEDEVGTVILEPKFHVLCEEIKELKNVEFGFISLNKLNKKDAFAIVKAYDQFLKDFNVDNFYNTLNNLTVEYYKGAYNIKSMLLKGGKGNE